MRRCDYGGPDDLVAMQRAVQRTWTPQQRWHIGDLAWGQYAIPAAQESMWRTSLWLDSANAVVAWGWIELPGHLDWYVDPDHPEIVRDVVEWFEAETTGADRTVTVLDTEQHLLAALEQAGYRQESEAPFFQHCLVDLDESLAAARAPAGYHVRAVGGNEAEARAAAHRAVWRPARIGALFVPPVDLGDAESGVTTESYQAVMNAWPYRRDLDQVVEASDGTLAAFALGWLDGMNKVGELEPVGTDPRYVRRGLGSVVSLACLHALRAAGATKAVVYPRGDNAYPIPRQLYFNLGFRPVARTVTYIRSITSGRSGNHLNSA
jgi:ribosomal protein S18 acetylase RimI-like enzyme